jgi:SAM-dependent methyltransferase
MRICVLQSSYAGSDHVLSEHDPYADPSGFTDQHTFEHRWILKATAKTQIDALVTEGFDFYFNFMWGQHDDKVAGIEACKYFESFGLPFIGLQSRVLERSKHDFYRDARVNGSPRVPGQDKFPLFVKPATSCASKHITGKSICYDEAGLAEALKELNEALEPGRQLLKRPVEFSSLPGISSSISIPNDIVFQEFFEGSDFSVVIIEVGDCPVPLSPERYVYSKNPPAGKTFLTNDVKFHPDTHLELMQRELEQHLFDKLQKAAVEAFLVNKMQGSGWGNVDIRVTPSGEPVVIEVNPMPAVFLPKEHQCEDLSIERCFPGGHRALINTLIASYQIRRPQAHKTFEQVGSTYDRFSDKYDDVIVNNTKMEELVSTVISKCKFRGSILDLGCGTGLFGRTLVSGNAIPTPPPEKSEDQGSSVSRKFTITGVELSPGMITKCENSRAYQEVHQGSLQSVLPSLGSFDHIVCFSMSHFLPTVDLNMVLVSAFRLAQKSIAFTVDDIPDEYNEHLKKTGDSHMVSQNHLKEMEAFGVPLGWKLADRFTVFGWKSPHTGHKIYTTVFIFERERPGFLNFFKRWRVSFLALLRRSFSLA